MDRDGGACLPPPRLQCKLDDAERPIEEQEQDPLRPGQLPLDEGRQGQEQHDREHHRQLQHQVKKVRSDHIS